MSPPLFFVLYCTQGVSSIAGKDIAEKKLLAHSDVFADVANMCLFNGEPVIKPEALRDASVRSISRERGELREHERDVAKFWVDGEVIISMIGIENQTSVDHDMCIRVMGYDGDAYRSEIDDDVPHKPKKRYPVITFVLYYGERKWTAPVLLSERVGVPAKLRPFFKDYGINLIDVPRMTDEQLLALKSDFAIVADYLTQLERTGEYEVSRRTISHTDSLLKLMSAVTGNRDFEDVQNDLLEKERVSVSMFDVLSKVKAEGRAEGRAEGEAKGMAKGKADGIISMGREFRLSDENIISRLMAALGLSHSDAANMLMNFA